MMGLCIRSEEQPSHSKPFTLSSMVDDSQQHEDDALRFLVELPVFRNVGAAVSMSLESQGPLASPNLRQPLATDV